MLRSVPSTPTLADVEAAATRIDGAAWHTPLIHSPWLSDVVRADVWLKLESVQATGSFKIRGAMNAVARLRETRTGVSIVVTASAGNHGRAIATAARRLGLRARVHLPVMAPAAKQDALRRLGAEVVAARSYDEAEARAQTDARDTGAAYISAYDNEDVIAGAGTVAMEIFAEKPRIDTLVVPLGGGGLLAGTAVVARARQARVTLVGAEAEASPVFSSSIASGRIESVEVQNSLADGLAGNIDPNSQTFGIVRKWVDRIELVSEASIESAMRQLLLRDRLVAEGAAATAIGALLQGELGVDGRAVAVILTGRNVDGHILEWLLAKPH